VLTWLASLTQRAFVGTESRLMTVFELLGQMVEGSETDPQARIRELQKQRQHTPLQNRQGSRRPRVAGEITQVSHTG